MKTPFLGFFAITLLFGLTACRTPEMKIDNAIYQARECVVDEIRDLNEAQISHIKFAIPEYQSMPVFKASRKGQTTNLYTEAFSTRPSGFDRTDKRPIRNSQYLGSFVWFLPESKDVIVVSGVGLADLSDWHPIRAVKRPLLPANPHKYTALGVVKEKALSKIEPFEVNETLNNQLRNMVRFESPEVYFLPSEKPHEGTSYFIWQLPNRGNALVVRGNGTDDFAVFKITDVTYEDPAIFRLFTRLNNFGELPSLKAEDYIQ